MKEGNPRHQVHKLISFLLVFWINRSFRGLSTYTVIINSQLQRKQKQYSSECAILANSSNKFPVTCTVPCSVTSASPFGLFASDGP